MRPVDVAEQGSHITGVSNAYYERNKSKRREIDQQHERTGRLTLRPYKTGSQEAQPAYCAGGPGLPEGRGQVGQALAANDCSLPAVSSDSSCSAVCQRPHETRERKIKTRNKEKSHKETQRGRGNCLPPAARGLEEDQKMATAC